MRSLAFAALLAALAPAVSAQDFSTYNGRTHPEVRWMEAETPHFRIVYPAHLAGIENEAAAIAESTYAVLSANLQTSFRHRIPIYLSDTDEIVNGFATPLLGEGYTMIWVRQNGHAAVWTGRHKWLRKVIAHELVHLFHLQATRSGIGLAGFLFANPLPRFWSEGLAQYETEVWDSERGERWLRTAALEGRLNYDDGASTWNGRLLYAVGNSQTRFFAQQYGDSAIVRLLHHRTPYLFGLVRASNFENAFRYATGGESYDAFAARWRRHLSVQAGSRAAGLAPPESLGVRLRMSAPGAAMGQYTDDLRPLPDTSRWIGVRLVSLERPVVQLVVANSQRVRVLAEGAIEAPVAVSPDGKTVAFAQNGRARHGSIVPDLYTVEVATGRISTLTRNRRASLPTFAPDGQRLAFVVNEGGTANVVIRDLTTGVETRATSFTGDVQASGLAWRPGSEQIAVAVFAADGSRTVQLVDLASGRINPLTPDDDDFRAPVWNADGSALATTSLRDGVPNVFVVSVAPDGTPSPPERVTAAMQGATATAWLASGTTAFADSVRSSPTQQAIGDRAGRLVVLTGVSKGGDRAYLVDAARRTPEPPDTAPEAYTAWEAHRPPRTVPDVVPPDPSLVTARRRYNSVARTQHLISLPFPYVSNGVWGVGGATAWLEPLGKHQLIAAGAVTPTDLDESFALLTYRNTVLGPTLDLSAYRYPQSARLYSGSVLVERLLGADVVVRQPFNLGRTPYTSAGMAVRFAVEYADPLNADSLVAAGLPRPVAGTQATATVGFGRRRERPYAHNAVHPLDGYGVRSLLTVGAATDNRARFVRADAAAYAVLPGLPLASSLPGLGLHRLMVYGRVAVQAGDNLPQDYLGLARADEIQYSVPSYLPISFGRHDRVRGYTSVLAGRSLAFGSVEYRMPLGDLNTSVLGQVRLGATSLALFADGAVVGQTEAFGDATTRLGYGAEIKNEVNLAGLLLAGHAVGVAWPAERGGDMETYYRIRLGVPF
ncbi:MAG: DPP IV N-terminal domain-containing protein [Bacteroidetes bacterium]|nr:DPP IV N-terminal domain-containing protein [Bacteroidota bacterium]